MKSIWCAALTDDGEEGRLEQPDQARAARVLEEADAVPLPALVPVRRRRGRRNRKQFDRWSGYSYLNKETEIEQLPDIPHCSSRPGCY
jgi:hypothetical protein